MYNASDDIHPMHASDGFEIMRIGGEPNSDVIKCVAMLGGYRTATRNCIWILIHGTVQLRVKIRCRTMRLSRFAYYADFVAYPVVVITLTVMDLRHLEHQFIGWLSACALGLVVWTLLEYALHRVALHRMPVFSRLHASHHGAPLELIGTATWVSVPVWCATILVPLWASLGQNIATGIAVGVMLGYWWYGLVHHIIHHRAHEKSFAYFKRLRAWHMRHHHSPKYGNFGVTTRMWDHLFGTAIDIR